MAARFKVVPHKTWGTMPFKLQPRWNGLNCAKLVQFSAEVRPNALQLQQQQQRQEEEPILVYKSKKPSVDMQQLPHAAKSTPVPAYAAEYLKQNSRHGKRTPMHNIPMPTPTQQQLDAVNTWHRKHDAQMWKDKMAEQKNRYDLREVQFNAAMKWRQDKTEQMWIEKHLTQSHQYDRKTQELKSKLENQLNMQQAHVSTRDKQLDAVHRWQAKNMQDTLENKRMAHLGMQQLASIAAKTQQQQKAVQDWHAKKDEERGTAKMLLDKMRQEHEELTKQSNSRIATKKQVDATLRWHQHKAVQAWNEKQDEQKAHEASLSQKVEAEQREKKALEDLQQSHKVPKFPTEKQIHDNLKWHQHKAVQHWQDKRDEQAARSQLALKEAMEEQARQQQKRAAIERKEQKHSMDMQQAKYKLPTEKQMLANLKWHQEKAAQKWQDKQDEITAKEVLVEQRHTPKVTEPAPANYQQLKAVKKWHRAHKNQRKNDGEYVKTFKHRKVNPNDWQTFFLPKPPMHTKQQAAPVANDEENQETATTNDKENQENDGMDSAGVESDELLSSPADLQQHQQQHQPAEESEVQRLRRQLSDMRKKMSTKPSKKVKKEMKIEGKGLNPFQGSSIFDDASISSMMPGGM